CGIMPYSSSGYLTVEQGLDKLRGRNVVLSILEELTAGREEETIKKYLGYMRDYPTMRFQFSGLYWRKKDDRFIKDLHKRVDEYYYKLYGGGQ
ncbi:MAG: hypothetical protein Q8O57_06575, partial [Kiritimatiellota bacterium]|nr:hypothetical protein [Kiritimatiellota bacterium]